MKYVNLGLRKSGIPTQKGLYGKVKGDAALELAKKPTTWLNPPPHTKKTNRLSGSDSSNETGG